MGSYRERCWTILEAAEHYGVNRRTVQKWCSQGKLHAVKRDGSWFVFKNQPIPRDRRRR